MVSARTQIEANTKITAWAQPPIRIGIVVMLGIEIVVDSGLVIEIVSNEL